MAKISDITVEVKAKLTVDRKTAEACLKMVEMYVNQSKDDIVADRDENNELTFRFVRTDT
jgi:hypothetical protein